MGAAQGCTGADDISRCCNDVEKVDMHQHVSSYAAPSTHVPQSEQVLIREQQLVEVSAPPPASAPSGSMSPHQTPGDAAAPAFGDNFVPPPDPLEAKSPQDGSASPTESRNHSPRTAADWAQEQHQFEDMPPLPAGWIRARSKTSGAIYYCCQATGQTTFMQPTASQAVMEAPGLPPDWVEKTSRSTGKAYYWNVVQQRAQFERPTMPTGSEGKEPQRLGDKTPLPEGWVAMVSRSTGKPYYFNSKLQKSQFDAPTE